MQHGGEGRADVPLSSHCQFLFKTSLAMLTLQAPCLQALHDASAIFNALSRTPQCMNDPDTLLRLRFLTSTDKLIFLYTT